MEKEKKEEGTGQAIEAGSADFCHNRTRASVASLPLPRLPFYHTLPHYFDKRQLRHSYGLPRTYLFFLPALRPSTML